MWKRSLNRSPIQVYLIPTSASQCASISPSPRWGMWATIFLPSPCCHYCYVHPTKDTGASHNTCDTTDTLGWRRATMQQRSQWGRDGDWDEGIGEENTRGDPGKGRPRQGEAHMVHPDSMFCCSHWRVNAYRKKCPKKKKKMMKATEPEW